jgi:hypothetical protein
MLLWCQETNGLRFRTHRRREETSLASQGWWRKAITTEREKEGLWDITWYESNGTRRNNSRGEFEKGVGHTISKIGMRNHLLTRWLKVEWVLMQKARDPLPRQVRQAQTDIQRSAGSGEGFLRRRCERMTELRSNRNIAVYKLSSVMTRRDRRLVSHTVISAGVQ